MTDEIEHGSEIDVVVIVAEKNPFSIKEDGFQHVCHFRELHELVHEVIEESVALF